MATAVPSAPLVTRLCTLVDGVESLLEAVTDEQRLLVRLAEAAAGLLRGTASVCLVSPDAGLDPVVVNHPQPLVDALQVALGGQRPARLAELLAGRPLLILAGAGARAPEGPDDERAEPAAEGSEAAVRRGSRAAGRGDRAAGVLAGHGLSALAMVPIRVRGRVLGALAVTRAADAAPLDDDDVALGLALAGLAGTTLANARMLADSTAAMDDLRRHGELMDRISDAMIACDTQWQVVSWNSGAEQLYGYPPGEALGCDLFALLATEFNTDDDAPLDRAGVERELELTGGWRGELHERHADGAPLVILSSMSVLADADHGRTGVVVVNRDVTAQRREEHRALHDPLTGLANRRLLVNRLYDALARAFRTASPLAVLFVDLDGFKPVNDQYGHAAGDEVLRATGRRLTAAVRGGDTVARLGGDEFVVVLENAGSAVAVGEVAQRVVDSVAAPVAVEGARVSVRPSIGVAYTAAADGAPVSPEQLLAAADEAMYTAKRSRGGVAFAPDGSAPSGTAPDSAAPAVGARR